MSVLGRKVISVTPAGRKRYLKILSRYLLANRHIIDEHHWWINTNDPEDRQYIEQLCEQYPDFFKAIPNPRPIHKNLFRSIGYFFEGCTEPGTVYVRIDDDVVWIENGAIEKLVKCRLENPEPLIIVANAVNNAICGHLHERFGVYQFNKQMIKYKCMCRTGWASPVFAEFTHRTFFRHYNNGELNRYKFPYWIIWEKERISINCICFTGEDMAAIYGMIPDDEEQNITVTIPKKINKYVAICGEALVAHFSFYTQRKHLDSTDILEKYEALADEYLAEPTPDLEKILSHS
ncbi:MAG: hypothetical protein GX568_06815 [Candidatus Gastranaerophilales bacterium]|nr:hypothetical protein [Candidatus Gastranaerophilales bacterium]